VLQERIVVSKVDPEAYRVLYPIEKYLSASGLKETDKKFN
jgi:hypothetical protein